MFKFGEGDAGCKKIKNCAILSQLIKNLNLCNRSKNHPFTSIRNKIWGRRKGFPRFDLENRAFLPYLPFKLVWEVEISFGGGLKFQTRCTLLQPKNVVFFCKILLFFKFAPHTHLLQIEVPKVSFRDFETLTLTNPPPPFMVSKI